MWLLAGCRVRYGSQKCARSVAFAHSHRTCFMAAVKGVVPVDVGVYKMMHNILTWRYKLICYADDFKRVPVSRLSQDLL
jgi:hypothetical protein